MTSTLYLPAVPQGMYICSLLCLAAQAIGCLSPTHVALSYYTLSSILNCINQRRSLIATSLGCISATSQSMSSSVPVVSSHLPLRASNLSGILFIRVLYVQETAFEDNSSCSSLPSNGAYSGMSSMSGFCALQACCSCIYYIVVCASIDSLLGALRK